jgi:hypothetical protein
MSCIKSYSFVSTGNPTVTTPQLVSWLTGVQNSFVYDSGSSTSNYIISGFKNVNVHGVKIVGDVGGRADSGNGAIIDDWAFTIRIRGEVPLISGNVLTSPNFFNITTASPSSEFFTLSKYNPSVEFADPFQSVKNIELSSFGLSGHSQQTPGTVELSWNFQFIVYYTYEGE